MSSPLKVVPIRSGRPRARSAEAESAVSQERVLGLEHDGIRAWAVSSGDVVRLLRRLLGDAGRGLRGETIAKALAALYFAWHSEEVDEFGFDRKFTESVRPLFEFLYALWWRVEATGLERIPDEGAALVVANHSGVLPWDGIMINLAIRHEHPARRECRLLALDMFALLPVLAPLLARTGAVRASPENGEQLLRRGELVGVFPEGVKGVGKYFRDRYKLARFGRGGFVRLALRTGAPIVPCAVVGAEEIHPVIGRADGLGRLLGLPYFPITPTFPALGALGLVPLPTKWSIDFAEPVAMHRHGPEAADDPRLVHRLSEQVRSTIQAMIDRHLARRRSVWLG